MVRSSIRALTAGPLLAAMVLVPAAIVEAQVLSAGVGGGPYAVIHYLRGDGNYGDMSSPDYNDYWGLHLWGEDLGEPGTEWTAPKPFLGEDEYGRFAWLKLKPEADQVNFVVHRGDVRDGTDADRSFNPGQTPEIWLKQGDATTYTSQATAQGFATVHYRRPDGIYSGWGLHLWGDAVADGVGTDWATPRPFDGIDPFGAYWKVPLKDATKPLNFIIHKGDEKDPGPDQSFIPAEDASKWVMSGDETLYAEKGGALGLASLHYHRPAGDYGDYTSTNYNDFWGLHTWADAADPGWTTPRKPARFDGFGPVFEVPLVNAKTQFGYILHRGDQKDPGPDQALNVKEVGYEVWQLQDADPADPYLLPMVRNTLGSITVAKTTVPAGGTGFEFTAELTSPDGTSPVPASFQLDDQGTQPLPGLLPGTYEVVEYKEPGYYLSGLACTGAIQSTVKTSEPTGTAEIDLAAGENITCTFENTRYASVTIDKVTVPPGDPTPFTYTTTGLFPVDTFTLTDQADPRVFPGLVVGTYSIVEGNEPGWVRSDLVCLGDEDSAVTIDRSTGTVDISLAAGEDISCTYTNTRLAPTAISYTGDRQVIFPAGPILRATLTDTQLTCNVAGQTIQFHVDVTGDGDFSDPGEDFGSAVTSGTNNSAVAAKPAALPPGVYLVKVEFTGSNTCAASVDTGGILTVVSPDGAASGGGWYQIAGVTGVNKTVNLGLTTRWSAKEQAYRGQILIQNKQAWRLKGEITAYAKATTSPLTGTASGTGQLFQWQQVSPYVFGYVLVDDLVTFKVTFTDSGSDKKGASTQPDTFTVNWIAGYGGGPVSPLVTGATLQPLKGGNITIQ